ncbi:unnamed protein product [Amoebophrya sp. A25]|nr:unnamed protein product [Amoebophrya sp. A25]|eukprot:GSA25T00008162001.1
MTESQSSSGPCAQGESYLATAATMPSEGTWKRERVRTQTLIEDSKASSLLGLIHETFVRAVLRRNRIGRLLALCPLLLSVHCLASWILGVSAISDLRPDDYSQNGVTLLTADNFEDFITSHKYVLVQFYAPWCGHCKQFRTEYIKAAQKLQERDPPIPFGVVDATVDTKLAELYGVRGYPTLKFFVSGKDMEYAGGRMWDNIVAWVDKKSGPILVHLKTAEEVNVFFDAKAKDATPSGSSAAIGGGIVVAFCDDPEKIETLEDVGVTFDDIFFGLAPNSLLRQVVDDATIARGQAVVDAESSVKNLPSVKITDGDVVYMRYPFDEGAAVAPIVTPDAISIKGQEEYWERVGDDIRFFIAVYSMPNVNVFTGENAALLFNDPRPMLVYFRDEGRGALASESHKDGIVTQQQLIEDSLHQLAVKYKQDFVVVLAGAEQPMDMRLMDYVSVDYEDLPCIRIVKDPTDGMVKYKLPIQLPDTESEDSDLNYLNNALAVTPSKIEDFCEDFLDARAAPHLKSQHAPSQNTRDQGQVFTLVGEEFLDTLKSSDVLVKFYAPWCGHCKKLEPLYRDLAAKYNVPDSTVLIAKFDATANDLPLEVEEVIQGYPTLKLYRRNDPEYHSVHYVGDRNLDTMIQFVEQYRSKDTDSPSEDAAAQEATKDEL